MRDVFDSGSFLEKWKIYIPDDSYAKYLFDRKKNKTILNNKKKSYVVERFEWDIADNILIDVKRDNIYKVILLLLQQPAGVLTKINEKMYDKDGDRNDFLENSYFDDVEKAIIGCGGNKLLIGYSSCKNYLNEIQFVEEENKIVKNNIKTLIKEQEFLNEKKQNFFDCILQDKRFIDIITKIISDCFKSMNNDTRK